MPTVYTLDNYASIAYDTKTILLLLLNDGKVID